METITLVAAGWASGINAYLTVLLLGLSGRLGWADTPSAFQRNWVLAASGVLFAIEFVVDKVPIADSVWDVVHTVVRPSIGAAVGGAIAGTQLGQPWASLAAGGLALTAHSAKATTRLAINAIPEPFTNIAASVGEDSAVLTIVLLAIHHPNIAAVAAIIMLVIGVLIALALARLARRGWRVVQAVRHRTRGVPPASGQAAAPTQIE